MIHHVRAACAFSLRLHLLPLAPPSSPPRHARCSSVCVRLPLSLQLPPPHTFSTFRRQPPLPLSRDLVVHHVPPSPLSFVSIPHVHTQLHSSSAAACSGQPRFRRCCSTRPRTPVAPPCATVSLSMACLGCSAAAAPNASAPSHITSSVACLQLSP